MSPVGGGGNRDWGHTAHSPCVVLPAPAHRRDLPHRVTEADRGPRSARRVPRKQRGGHQRATHHRRTETQQAAVLPEPVTAPRLVSACVHVLVLRPPLTALSSLPTPSAPL